MAQIIDGKALAATIQADITAQVQSFLDKGYPPPGLAFVRVGSRADSASYLALKQKAATACNINSKIIEFPAETTEEELLVRLDGLNADPAVHGIIVQLPLPPHMRPTAVAARIAPSKDVDAFHPMNVAALWTRGLTPDFVPCTPSGIMELIRLTSLNLNGAQAVVIGRSDIVGLPMAKLLLDANATVTVCHSKTKDLRSACLNADLIVAAVGQAQLVKGDWVKPGAVVIDVGTNTLPDATKKAGYRLVGDVSFEEVSKVAGYITPVPGGVGPMTVCMLLKNTLDAYARVQKK